MRSRRRSPGDTALSNPERLRRLTLVAGVLLAGMVGPRAQTLAPQPQQPAPPTFRIATELATVDAVVVDADGRHVTDLAPADFEIVERGKRQTVRQAVYVRVVNPDGTLPPQPAPAAAHANAPGEAPAAPATSSTRPLAGNGPTARPSRVIAIVVDDLGMSLASGSIAYTRQMLTRYVDEHVGPHDLVAILRTSGGAGALQQFTTDRRLLRAAIDRVRFSFLSRPGLASFDAVPLLGSSGGADIEKLREVMSSIGTLGALEYVIRGIEPLPGRKSVVFVSEGFDLGFRERTTSPAYSAFQRVMNRANRAGVVVYTIDPRGLQTAGLTAEDATLVRPPTRPYEPSSGSTSVDPPPFGELMRSEGRRRTLTDTQESLRYLADQTGGFAVVNTNDLTAGLMRTIDDMKGYYLIGFDTAIGPDEPWDPGDIRIRVRRSGLRVRARRGLFGPADHGRPRETRPTDPLVAATLSPFNSDAIDVRLTTLFAHDKDAGSYVRTLFFIDPAALTFIDGPDGRHHADLSLLLVAIDDKGQAAGQVRLQVPLRLDDAAYGQLRQQGLLYSARVAIREPGGYQIRTAVRDDRSGAIGTSAQFVEAPRVGRQRVALSGVVMIDADAAPRQPGIEAGDAALTLAADTLASGVLGEPAVRIFKPGARVVYSCEIYDGRSDRSSGFSTQATILRDGKPIFTSPPAPLRGGDATAGPIGTVPVGGAVQLGRDMPRGVYTLQVSVAPRAGGRTRQASQWVDFEVR